MLPESEHTNIWFEEVTGQETLEGKSLCRSSSLCKGTDPDKLYLFKELQIFWYGRRQYGSYGKHKVLNTL